jgi:hypothetical protein
MTARSTFWPAVGLALIAAHVALAFGASHLIFWLYFDVDLKWTTDPVVPQIQAVLATISMSITSLIFVPAGLAGRRHTRLGIPIAIGWPLACIFWAFLPPLILLWIPIGIILLMRPGPNAPQ